MFDVFLTFSGVKVSVKNPEASDVAMETNLLTRLRELKLRHTMKFEGRSEGYETLTTERSDLVSEVITLC